MLKESVRLITFLHIEKSFWFISNALFIILSIINFAIIIYFCNDLRLILKKGNT